jgi:hypothetical protein
MKNRVGWSIVGAVLIFKIISHALVLFPISINLGQGAVPWLMGQGKILYRDIFEHRPPLTAWIVALAQGLFRGDTLLTVRMLHLLTVLITMVLIYVVVRRLGASITAAVLAVLYFAALESVFVNTAFYYEVVQGALYIGAACLLVRENTRRWEYFAAGLLLGLAFLTKQQAALAVALALLWLWWAKRSLRDVALLTLGAAIPVGALAALYALGGLWQEFYFWNVTFNAQFAGGVAGAINGDFFRRMLLTHGWMLPFAFLAFKGNKRYWLILGLGLIAQTAQLPRLGEIHAAAGLPLLCVETGIVLASLAPLLRKWRAWTPESATAVGLSAVLLVGMGFNVMTSYIPTPAGFRAILGVTEFSDLDVWLRAHASPGDTLFVLPASDSTAQVQMLTGLLPPGTWVIGNHYEFGAPFVIDTLLREWQTAPPTWVILFPDIVKEEAPPGAKPLLDFVNTRYEVRQAFGVLPFYGEALALHLKAR